MQTVTSRDGTRIAFWRGGEGPPLLLVHGAVASHATTWRLVRPMLERHFTVYAMDRRGRGGSGDAPDYGLHREAEDVAAVIDSVGEPVNVLAHSFGGICALEASLLTDNVRRLVLYEGAVVRGTDQMEPGTGDRLQAMVDAGDVEGMLVTMLREVALMSERDIETMRSDREAWAVRLKNAPTVPRELKAGERYELRPERFRDMSTPIVLLVGGDSPPRELQNARRVAEALPDARVEILEGQRHVAMYTAPDAFVDAVVRFLTD